MGKTFSFSAWQALERAYGSISQSRQLQLHTELQSLRRNDLTISQYLLTS